MTLSDMMKDLYEDYPELKDANDVSTRELVFATSDDTLEVLSVYPLDDGRICFDLQAKGG